MAASDSVHPRTGALATLLGERRDGPRPKASSSYRDMPGVGDHGDEAGRGEHQERYPRAPHGKRRRGPRLRFSNRATRAGETEAEVEMGQQHQHHQRRSQDHQQPDGGMQDVDGEVLAEQPAGPEHEQDPHRRSP